MVPSILTIDADQNLDDSQKPPQFLYRKTTKTQKNPKNGQKQRLQHLKTQNTPPSPEAESEVEEEEDTTANVSDINNVLKFNLRALRKNKKAPSPFLAARDITKQLMTLKSKQVGSTTDPTQITNTEGGNKALLNLRLRNKLKYNCDYMNKLALFDFKNSKSDKKNTKNSKSDNKNTKNNNQLTDSVDSVGNHKPQLSEWILSKNSSGTGIMSKDFGSHAIGSSFRSSQFDTSEMNSKSRLRLMEGGGNLRPSKVSCFKRQIGQIKRKPGDYLFGDVSEIEASIAEDDTPFNLIQRTTTRSVKSVTLSSTMNKYGGSRPGDEGDDTGDISTNNNQRAAAELKTGGLFSGKKNYQNKTSIKILPFGWSAQKVKQRNRAMSGNGPQLGNLEHLRARIEREKQMHPQSSLGGYASDSRSFLRNEGPRLKLGGPSRIESKNNMNSDILLRMCSNMKVGLIKVKQEDNQAKDSVDDSQQLTAQRRKRLKKRRRGKSFQIIKPGQKYDPEPDDLSPTPEKFETLAEKRRRELTPEKGGPLSRSLSKQLSHCSHVYSVRSITTNKASRIEGKREKIMRIYNHIHTKKSKKSKKSRRKRSRYSRI